MKTVIFICGLYCFVFAIFHLLFWKIFDWRNDLKKLSFANKGIIQILNSRIIYLFLFISFICFAFPDELLHSKLGKAFLTGISIFWLGRAIEQFIFFKSSNIYLHILTIIFVGGTILFALPVLF